MEFNKKTEIIEHPLEKVFDLPECTTIVSTEYISKEEVVSTDEYDDKDIEIESQIQDVYELAIEAYHNQVGIINNIEPQFSSRNAEVANQFLGTALDAIREKRQIKQHKDKIKQQKTISNNTVNNNLIIDRNEMLRLMLGKGE